VSGDKWIEIPHTQRSARARVSKPQVPSKPEPSKAASTPGSRTSYVQDAFYQHLITGRIPVEVTFLDGTTLVGTIDGFDTYAILVVSGDEEVLLFKSAIRAIRRYVGAFDGDPTL